MVVGALSTEFRNEAEKLDQPAGGFVIAAAEARHQPGYGIGLKSRWGRHLPV